jgi:hypothetical protein
MLNGNPVSGTAAEPAPPDALRDAPTDLDEKILPILKQRKHFMGPARSDRALKNLDPKKIFKL